MAEKKEAFKKVSQAGNFYYIFNKQGKIIDFKYFDKEPTREEIDKVVEDYEKRQRGEI